MAFCANCGAEIQDGATLCPVCSAGAAQPGAGQFVESNQVDEAADASNNKLMGILSYILWFVPLITGDYKKSPFVKFHANQGLLVFICSIAYSIVSFILRAILGAIFPLRYNNGLLALPTRGPIYGLLSFIIGIASLAILALAVIGIMNAANGKKKPLPIIGGFTILK